MDGFFLDDPAFEAFWAAAARLDMYVFVHPALRLNDSRQFHSYDTARSVGREFSLVMVGAILTIAGYSINDKIVVFDRIREGLRSGRKGSIQYLMNASINDTLSRTILTSGVTLLCMLSLLFFGGPVLADFAFTNVVGVIVGTYSSIFIAAPIVLWWSNLRRRNLRQEVSKPKEEPAKRKQVQQVKSVQ